MPEYLAPGVYVEEIATGPVPIEGVSTSTAGFVGQTERGPDVVTLTTSWIDFQRVFGGLVPRSTSTLPHAAKGFFDNGGQRAFISRITGNGAGVSSITLATTDNNQDLTIRAKGAGAWGDRLFVRVDDASKLIEDPNNAGQFITDPDRFRISIIYYSSLPSPLPGGSLVDPLDPANITDPNRLEPDAVEDYDGVGFDPQGGSYVLTVLANSNLVRATWTDTDGPYFRPNNVTFDAGLLTGGSDVAPTSTEYIGDGSLPVSQRTGLVGLEVIDEISILAAPDHANTLLFPSPGGDAQRVNITNELVNQCERQKDRFAVLAVENNQGNVANINPPRDTSYAAIYYPWIRVYDPATEDYVLVPPVGHVAGVYARTDIERGVHKAPANEVVRGILTADLSNSRTPTEYKVTKGQQDILNPRGVNVIRDFRADRRGIRVWGGRTMSSNGQWKYVNVRRLFIFVEESVDEGTQWVVFEPNDEPTWARVRRSVGNFLNSVWRSGALMGATADEAYFVRCDRTTMTQDDIDNGRLICYVGIAPVKPAEFVIFRFSQKTIEAQ